MPALKAYGRAFYIASDDVPLFALGGAIFHLFWIVAIAITARNILDMPDICKGQDGLYYVATVAFLLVCFATGFVLELLLMWQGCQGCIFEPSKRRGLQMLLTLRAGNVICEVLASAFGTYVLAATDVACKVKEVEQEVVVFNPKKEVIALVVITWVFQIITLLNWLILYNAWPDQKGAETWEQRFVWLGRYVCCQCSNEQAEDEQRRRSLRRIAKWVTRLLGTADLTPSDSAVALVLVATLQRQARKERIQRAIEVGREAEREGTPPSQAISLMERAGTIQALPVSTARGSIDLTRAHTHSPIKNVTHGDVLIDIEEEEGEDTISASSPREGARSDADRELSGAMSQSGAMSPRDAQPTADSPRRPDAMSPGASASAELEAGKEAENIVKNNDDGKSGLPAGTGASESLQGEGGVGHSPLDKFVRQMALIREATITPSGMDEELRDGMSQERAVQLYTGSHWRVEAATLADVEHFTKFATGIYGYGGSNASSIWGVLCRSLIPGNKEDRDQQKRDILNKAEVNSLYERLFYENVLTELGESSEIIYLSVANAALAHLPYLVALDHQSRSVVVALRGTTSVEDIITDSVAEPQRLDPEWIPKSIRDEANGPLYAHAGIKAAADAVLKDMEDNKILRALIEGDYGGCEQTVEEEVQEKDQGKSARTKQQHYVAALMQRKLDCRNWRLVLTGHSLGAGAAALIALHLKGRFANLHCWALSPPGGLMSTNLSRLVQPFVTSVVVGKDVVPRVSVVNLGRLIDQMVTSLALCKVNKSEMLLRRLNQHFRHKRTEELFWKNDEVPAEALKILQRYSVAIEARSRMLELVPPGRVIFLRPLKTQGARSGWDAVWVKAEEVIREGILISPRMVEDHSCMVLQEALRMAQQHPRRAGLGSSPFEAAEYIPPPPVPPVAQNAEVSDEARQGQPDTSKGDDMV